MDRAAHPVAPGWPARPAPPPAEGPGGQLRLDVLEQTGRCHRCRRAPAMLGRYCVRCCHLADPVEVPVDEGEGQAARLGDDGAAAPPQPPEAGR
jgi:hypothetical protein